MKLRFASVLLALALPLCAQDPAATDPTEAMFYKAFFLEKGQRDFIGAMALYEQFLAKAPEHKLAADAAKQQFQLLDRTGKTKERDAFKAKYEKLLGNVASAPAAGGAAAGGGGDRPARGEGGEGRGPGGAGAGGGARMDPAARLADLEKQLAKAKEDGKDDEVKRLEQQIERAKAGGGRGPGGAGAGGRRGGLMSLLGQDAKKIADMNEEELKTLKDGLGSASRMIEMVRGTDPDRADKLEKSVADLTKALDANNKEDAQKAVDAIKASMPQMGGRGRGRGGEAGGGGGGERPAGGGGGGGTSNGGGGGGGN